MPAAAGATTANLTGIAAANWRFVVVADDQFHHSDNGTTWKEGWRVAGIKNLRTRDGRFYFTTGTKIYGSDDGEFWHQIGVLPSTTVPEITPVSLWATNGTGGVAVQHRTLQGDGLIYSAADVFHSADQKTWTTTGPLPGTGPATSVSVQSLVQGNGRYLINYLASDISGGAAPSTSITACSFDQGATWTRSNYDGDNVALRLIYGNGWFLAVSNTGKIYRSADGMNYFPANANLPVGFNQDLTFGGGLFITRSTVGPTVLYGSVSGSDWRNLGALPVTQVTALAGTAYAQGRFMAIGRANDAGGAQPVVLTSQRAAPPVIRTQPAGDRIARMRRLKLSVGLEGAPTDTTYRWLKDGVPLDGKLTATLTISQVSKDDAGAYRCLVTNGEGTVGSDEVTIAVIDPTAGGRLVNLSVNTFTGTDEQQVNVGFALRGDNVKPVLIRGVGPTLANWDLTDFVPDPRLTLLRGGVVRSTNDNWGIDDGRSLGAFPLPVGSLDAVIAANVTAGTYAVLVGGNGNTTGRVLTEVYDNNLDDGETLLTNLSARAHLPFGSKLIVGFVVDGTTDLPVIIRGIGPTLAQYGVSNPVPFPQLQLFRGAQVIAENDRWSGDDGRDLGAFPLPTGSTDAVISVTLPPGVYTAHVRAQSPGTALLEIYDAQ